MANPQRGEVTLNLSGKPYKLVPTFENLAKLEESAGISILEFAQKVHQRTIQINDLATLISETADPPLEQKAAGEALLGEGLVTSIGPISKFLANALTGGLEGNSKPVKGE